MIIILHLLYRFGNRGTLSEAQEQLRKLNVDRDRIGSEIEARVVDKQSFGLREV